MIAPTVEHAPAKLNLALHVTGRREDGYHTIESVVAFTRFGDTISVSPAEQDSVAVTGTYAARLDGTNLVERARDVLRGHAAASVPVAIHLEKRIPVAAGLGGGSADAAATLRALCRVWRMEVPEDALCEIAMPLGADVPMCVLSRPLLARGIGERMAPLDLGKIADRAVLLVNPGTSVSTPEVFARVENPDGSALPAHVGSALEWLRATRNDLRGAATALSPEIEDVLERLGDAEFATMSGSGATCIGLYADDRSAAAAASRIRASNADWFVEATRFTGAKATS